MDLEIDHIGYAVKDMQSALRAFSLLGYTFSPIKPDEYRNVNVCVGTLLPPPRPKCGINTTT